MQQSRYGPRVTSRTVLATLVRGAIETRGHPMEEERDEAVAGVALVLEEVVRRELSNSGAWDSRWGSLYGVEVLRVETDGSAQFRLVGAFYLLDEHGHRILPVDADLSIEPGGNLHDQGGWERERLRPAACRTSIRCCIGGGHVAALRQPCARLSLRPARPGFERWRTRTSRSLSRPRTESIGAETMVPWQARLDQRSALSRPRPCDAGRIAISGWSTSPRPVGARPEECSFCLNTALRSATIRPLITLLLLVRGSARPRVVPPAGACWFRRTAAVSLD
jgi:hypothetical protein